MKKSITFRELKRLVNEGCKCGCGKFEESYGEGFGGGPQDADEYAKEYKVDPNTGIPLKDKNGRPIPRGFGDDLEDLKKKIANMSNDVKQKIMQFLFGGNGQMVPAYNESTEDGRLTPELKKMITYTIYHKVDVINQGGGLWAHKNSSNYAGRPLSGGEAIDMNTAFKENKITMELKEDRKWKVFMGGELIAKVERKWSRGKELKPRIIWLDGKDDSEYLDESSLDKSDAIKFLDDFEAKQGGEVAILTKSEEGKNYFTGVIADWMVNNNVDVSVVRRYKSVWNNINPSLLPGLIAKFKKYKQMDDEYERRRDAEAWAEDRMASMSDELGIPEEELNESTKITLTVGQLKKLVR